MHWVQSFGYSKDIRLINDFSHRQAEVWDGNPVGLLYVDGDHTKEGAKRDILSWSPHLAPGARIAVDDYGHPDWPGVGQAVDELVAEGVLEPIELFHDRLAVTRLKAAPQPLSRGSDAPVKATAVTSEGVHPSPVITQPGCLHKDCVLEHPHAGPAELPPMEVDSDMSDRQFVQEGELEDDLPGTSIDDLNLIHLKALAKTRGIILGARKDKRDLILQALRDGR